MAKPKNPVDEQPTISSDLDRKIADFETSEALRQKSERAREGRIQALERRVNALEVQMQALTTGLGDMESGMRNICIHSYEKQPGGFRCMRCGKWTDRL